GPEPTIELARNGGILSGLVRDRRARQLVIGFAAETGDEQGSVLDYGRGTLEPKRCDLLVGNNVGDGKAFEGEDNAGWLLSADGLERQIPLGANALLAASVWDAVSAVRIGS